MKNRLLKWVLVGLLGVALGVGAETRVTQFSVGIGLANAQSLSSGFSSRSGWGRKSKSATKKSATSAEKKSSGGYAKPLSANIPPAPSSGGYSKSAPPPQPSASGGYTKPTAVQVETAPDSSARGKTTSGGYTKPATVSETSKKPVLSKMDRLVARKQAAQALDERRERVQKTRADIITQGRKDATFQEVAGDRHYDSEAVSKTRAAWYQNNGRYPDRLRGSGMFDHNRSYGGLDNGFLMTMLYANVANRDRGDAMFWYALTGSPAFSLFMADAKKQAVSTGDQELLGRLQRVEEENARLKAQKVTPPPVAQVIKAKDIPPEVAFREEVLTEKATLTPLRFSAGVEGGMYQTFCQGNEATVGFKARAASLQTDCRTSPGSEHNLAVFNRGEVDAILVQADVADSWLRKQKQNHMGPFQLPIYPEPFWLLVNRDSGIDSVKDLKAGEHVLHVGPRDSGTASSWHNLAHYVQKNTLFFGAERYSGIVTHYGQPLASAAQVAMDPKQVMLIVVGIHSDLMRRIDETYGDRLKLVPFDDRHFDDVTDREGNPVYRNCTIPGGSYPKLQKGWLFTSVDTLCVDTLLVLSGGWVEHHGDGAESSFLEAASETIQEIKNLTRLE